MGYKITKYKGKTKLKDTKSGKSVEIDIDQLMNGGQKKDLYEYVLGGDPCSQFAPGTLDYEACKIKQQQIDKEVRGDLLQTEAQQNDTASRAYTPTTMGGNMVDGQWVPDFMNYNTPQSTGTEQVPQRLPNMPTVDITQAQSIRPNANMKVEGLNQDGTLRYAGDTPMADTTAAEEYLRKKGSKEEEDNYQLANPYAVTDLAGASTLLGQGIQSGDGNLTALAGTKLGLGLTRNFMTGASNANKFNRISKDAREDQRRGLQMYTAENGGSLQSFAYGGKKDEELATGDYIRGLDNRAGQQPNAEVEQGEYLQDGQGQVAQIVGKKHSHPEGGEEIQMDQKDRVLSDKLKIGKDAAKYLSDKYDIKLKATDTYATVLDRLRAKLKLKKVTDREADIIKKIDSQQEVTDSATRELNLQVLTENKKEIEAEKAPLKQMESEAFNELYEMQEYSKKKDNPEQENLENGGMLSSLAQEYGIPLERAQELIQQFSKGGKLPKYETADADCGPGSFLGPDGKCIKTEFGNNANSSAYKEGQSQRATGEGMAGDVNQDNLTQKLMELQKQFPGLIIENFDIIDGPNGIEGFTPKSGSLSDSIKSLQKSINNEYEKNKAEVKAKVKDPKKQAELLAEIDKRMFKKGAKNRELDGTLGNFTASRSAFNLTEYLQNKAQPEQDTTPNQEENSVESYLNTIAFPDQYPLPPSQLQGTIKPDRNYDMVTPNQIEIDPYLRDIRNREQSQMRTIEGISPNVGMAAQNNMRAISNRAEADIRNRVDLQNLQTREKAEYENNRIANREEDMNWRDRLLFEQRSYRAQDNTRNDWNNYYNNLQDINTQRFSDVQNLNLINASDENMYYDGRNFRRKEGAKDEDLYNQILKTKGLT